MASAMMMMGKKVPEQPVDMSGDGPEVSGDMDKDTFQRAKNGVTLKQRAVDDFLAWLVRIGVLAAPSQAPAGCLMTSEDM